MSSYYRSEFPSVPVASEPLHVRLLPLIRKYADEGRTAFIEAENGRRHTYAELGQAGAALNVFLKQRHFGHRDVAGAVLRNCWQFPAIFLGVISRGGCLSGASPLFTPAELAQQFRDAQCKVVFCMEYSLHMVLEAQKKCPLLKDVVVVDGDPKAVPNGVVHFNDIIKLDSSKADIYVDIDIHKDMVALPYSRHLTEEVLLKMDPSWDYSNEHFIAVLPFYHIYGFGMLWSTILSGAKAVIFQKYDPRLLLQVLQDYRVKFANLVPPILVYLSRSPLLEKFDLSHLKFIMTGAAPTGKELIDLVKQKIPSVLQISQAYGMTEQSMASHFSVFGVDDPACCGRLMSNYEMKVVHPETQQDVPFGTVGELLVRSPTIMLGYFNRPKATAETIDKDGWLHTGDLGYVTADGFTYIVDRVKELIKVKGLQVAPAELEDILLANPKVKDCAVVGIPHPDSGEVPKGFIVKADPTLTAHEVKQYLSGRVAHYKQLAGGVEFVDEIPKSPSGKILRRFLRDKKAKL